MDLPSLLQVIALVIVAVIFLAVIRSLFQVREKKPPSVS
jgi:hypothetical protein